MLTVVLPSISSFGHFDAHFKKDISYFRIQEEKLLTGSFREAMKWNQEPICDKKTLSWLKHNGLVSALTYVEKVHLGCFILIASYFKQKDFPATKSKEPLGLK